MGHPRGHLEGSKSVALEARRLPERVSNRLDTAQSDSVNCKFMAARIESRERRKEKRTCRHIIPHRHTGNIPWEIRPCGNVIAKNIIANVAVNLSLAVIIGGNLQLLTRSLRELEIFLGNATDANFFL